jgi:microcystin-dependent protein
MSEPFIGEIRMFAGTFAPRGWAFCDGQLLAISQNDALFSLLGTIYGGDGRTTFGLPDLRGRIPVHAGHGPGMSDRILGFKGGSEQVTLTTNQLPLHDHPAQALSKPGDSSNPENRHWAATSDKPPYYSGSGPDLDMAANALTSAGGNQAHTNMMPFLCIHFIIALIGIYPSRN